MFLESFQLKHFRKFNETDNIVKFISGRNDEKIDISKVSTLIIGQNNAGKSTIFKAFQMLYNGSKFSSSDFNYLYLSEYCDNQLLKSDEEDFCYPYIEFIFDIKIDDNSENLSNISQFACLNTRSNEVENARVIIEVRLKDESLFELWFKKKKNEFEQLGAEDEINNFKNRLKFDAIKKINEIGLVVLYFNTERKVDNVKFSDIFNYNLITALSVNDEKVLSKQFKSIIHYHFTQNNISPSEDVEKEIVNLNELIRDILAAQPSSFINNVIESIVSKSRVKMQMESDLTFEKVLDTCVKYFYNESGYCIPEEQYGLGYTRIVSIVANLLDYIERKPNNEFDNKVSIIAIEEPETFMHPQLQKNFICNINEVLNYIITSNNKTLNCQTLIATHSPFIVADKIEQSNSINNINYIGLLDNRSRIVVLEDELFETSNAVAFDNIKKHMNLALAEMMFADAVIFVEGYAEEKLVPYFLNNYTRLKNEYISIVNINGAHGHIYEKMLGNLNIPAVILTDIDFINHSGNQISSYKGQYTTNKTLINHLGTNSLDALTDCVISTEYQNLKIVVQEKENCYCGTTFEEAVILANPNNTTLSNAFNSIKRNNYYKAIKTRGKNKIHSHIRNKSLNLNKISRKLYNLIAKEKGNFTNALLKEMYTGNEVLNTPSYILKAFDFIANEVCNHEK